MDFMEIIIPIVIGTLEIHTTMGTASIIVMGGILLIIMEDMGIMILFMIITHITIHLITMEGIITTIITEIIMGGIKHNQLILQIMYLDTEEVFLQEIDT
jgi:hypothetical protein